ncbi:MAG: T9SS type A sorting domain-containing protein, partial [Chitinophagaceae bacterium]
LSNPANGFFNVQVGTSSTEKLSLKVTDMQGKLIENRQNISANQSLIFGNSYRPGIYFVEIIQGAERKQMKLVKAN